LKANETFSQKSIIVATTNNQYEIKEKQLEKLRIIYTIIISTPVQSPSQSLVHPLCHHG